MWVFDKMLWSNFRPFFGRQEPLTQTLNHSMPTMRAFVLLLALAIAASASDAVEKSSHHHRSGCQFYDFLRHDVVDAWEFQTKLPFKKLRSACQPSSNINTLI